MKPNRKRTKRMNVVASSTMHVFGVIVVLFAMVIVNMLASSTCSQQQKAIGEKRRLLASLEKDRERESARWDSVRTIDRLESALVRHGMNMKYPKSLQIILMDANGQPRVAQNSVREALRRKAPEQAAAYRVDVPVTSSVRAGVPPRARQQNRRARR